MAEAHLPFYWWLASAVLLLTGRRRPGLLLPWLAICAAGTGVAVLAMPSLAWFFQGLILVLSGGIGSLAGAYFLRRWK
ncbi:MAG: NfeD family protein [Alphaproteobacteria bacterium]